MGKTVEYSNPIVADKALREAQMYGPEDSSAWIVYDSGLTRTDFGFRNVRDSLTRANRPPTGLEMAGQGKVFQELDLEGVACCLAFPKFLIETENSRDLPIRTRSGERQAKVALVSGDLAQATTFTEIQFRFKTEAILKPNILLLTPAGGTNCLPQGQKFIDNTLSPAMAICDQESFVFLGDAPDGSESVLKTFLNAIEANTGAQTTLSKCGDSPVFGIYKKGFSLGVK